MTNLSPSDEEVLTLKEAAEFLRVDSRTLKKAADKLEVPSLKVGKHLRFSKRVLREVLEGSLTW